MNGMVGTGKTLGGLAAGLILAAVVLGGLWWWQYADLDINSDGGGARATFVIGSVSVDSEDDIKEYQPLADYLASELAEFGYQGGEVVVVKSAAEMAKLMRRGRVDLYIDSPFPTYAVDQLAESEPLVNRWKKGVEKYRTVLFVKKTSGVKDLNDLRGRVIAFDHPESTSGYFLPKASLLELGFKLTEVAGPEATVGLDEIGYYFVMDDLELVKSVVDGTVVAAATNENETVETLGELGEQVKNYTYLLTTPYVYRHVVTAGGHLDSRVKEHAIKDLINLDKTEEGRALLKKFKKTKKFTPFVPNPEAAYSGIEELLGLVENEIIER